MKQYFAPRVTSVGLVLPPPREDCERETCQTTAQHGRCFISRHHLYWPASKFAADSLSQRFRQHPFNSVSLPRCQHDRYHQRFAQAYMPPEDVMEAFLDEAKLLERMGVVLGQLESIEAAVMSNELRTMVHVTNNHLERYVEYGEESEQLMRRLGELEIIEPRLVVPHLGEFILQAA